jgi:hypothetical protein
MKKYKIFCFFHVNIPGSKFDNPELTAFLEEGYKVEEITITPIAQTVNHGTVHIAIVLYIEKTETKATKTTIKKDGE